MGVTGGPYRIAAFVVAVVMLLGAAACSTSASASVSRSRLLVLQADNGASVAACSQTEPVWDGNGSTMCLEPGPVLATGADVTAAEPVRVSGGWFVRVTLTPEASARIRHQPRESLVHEIVNGGLVNETDPSLPVLVGNGFFDEGAARDLAARLRP